MRKAVPWKNGWENHVCRVGVCLAVVATAALALVADRVDSYSMLLLLLVGMYLGFRYGFGRGLGTGEKVLIWVAFAYFAVALLCYLAGLQTDLGFRELGRFLRFIILIPAYLALRRLTPPHWLVWLAFVAGALIAGGNAIAQYVASGGLARAAGDSIAITFGDLALMTGFVAAVMTPTKRGGWRWVVVSLGVVGLIGGLTASVLSGTRGGWLAIPIYAALAMAVLTRELAPRWRATIGVAAVVIAVVLIAVPSVGVGPRIVAAVQSWNQYNHYRDQMATVPAATCISEPGWVRGLARLAIEKGAGIEAVRDGAALASAGFGQRCGGGMALHISNPDPNHGHAVFIPRMVARSNMPGFASLLVRGDGRVRLVGIPARRVHSNQYRQVIIKGRTQQYVRYVYLKARVSAGGELHIVPLQINPGAYRYFYTGTSVGTRLAMWGVAWDVFTDHWLIGSGTGAWRAVTALRIDAGQAAPVTSMYDHPHNQYLNALSSRGIVGLIELLLLLGVPAWLFAKRLGSRDEAVRRSAYAGMVAISGFAIFGITETIFNHSLTIDYYVILVGAFTAMMYAAEEEGEKSPVDEHGK